jgi:NADPH2:quinone reductase
VLVQALPSHLASESLLGATTNRCPTYACPQTTIHRYQSSLDSLARRGVCVFFGNASGPVPPIAPLALVAKSAFITRPKLNDYTVTRAELDSRTNDVFAAIAAGELEIKIDQSFPLAQAQDAHLYMEAGKTTGKVLLNMPRSM